MHIPSPDASRFGSVASPLAKRKREVSSGAWGQENGHGNLQGNIQCQFDIRNINMPVSTTTLSQQQWLHLQSTPNNVPGSGSGDFAKKRRILQPHSHYHQDQQQYLRAHSGNPVPTTEVQAKRPLPPTLMIPFFNSRQDAEISTASLSVADDYDDAVSPRTMSTPTGTETSTKLVLRPCHVCHRKPSTKVMLDAYADCELCGQRACYICLRECNALNCHAQQILSGKVTTSDGCFDTEMRFCDDYEENGRQRKICSLCAIEGVTDTGREIVWCVDCVRREGLKH